MAEPQRPRPEAFGLTSERLAEFDNALKWFFTRLFTVIFVLSFLWTVGEFFARGGRPNQITVGGLVGLLLALLFVGFFGLVTSALVATIVASGAAWIAYALWKWTQRDYGRFRSYESAVKHYKIEHAVWLKAQRFWWDGLDARRFEQEVAEFFKKQGHRVEWTGRSGDGGVDIRLTTPDGKKIIVQCKAHGKPVSPAVVRDLYGTLLHEKSDEAWLMSRSGFTVGAKKFVAGKAIRLMGLDHILAARGL
jgi:hypothetical protein